MKSGQGLGHALERAPLSYVALFAKFLRFGAPAWGGPVAQIGMMHAEIVEREQWVDEPTFRRVLGVDPALPCPEATELAVYVGYHHRGRLAGLLAGLAFVRPGFLLCMGLAAVYTQFGARLRGLEGILYAIRPVVIALIFQVAGHA